MSPNSHGGQLAGECVAVIPARGGSKRIPRKNIRNLGGRALIEWTIDVALGAESVERLVVSTEDEEIAAVAAHRGVEVVSRSPGLAEDDIPAVDVVVDVCRELEIRGATVECVCMLLPTSPFRTAEQIDRAIRLWHEEWSQRGRGTPFGVISVTDRSSWIRTLRTIENNRRLSVLPQPIRLVESNGAIQLMYWDDLKKVGTFHVDPVPFVMDEVTGFDIDTECDWAAAEVIVRDLLEV